MTYVSPKLTFACELETPVALELFSGSAALDDLAALEASVAITTPEFTAERAAAIRLLNERGIPATAILTVPKERGYFLNARNARQAAFRFGEFAAWTEAERLQWAGVALDIEPDFHDMSEAFLGRSKRQLVGRLLGRALDGGTYVAARSDYAELVALIRGAGYRVITFQFPFLADQRKARSAALERIFGVVDVRADQEVFMVYTSFARRLGPAFLWSYGRDAEAIAVGLTGGAAELEQRFPALSWEEFARDLRLARRRTDSIAVYSLEGCIDRGFLPRLREFDWEAPAAPPSTASLAKAELIRAALTGALWAGSHPWAAAGTLAVAAWMLSRRRAAA